MKGLKIALFLGKVIKDVNKRFSDNTAQVISDPTRFPVDVDKNAPKRTQIITQIIQKSLILRTTDNEQWENAVERAKREHHPSRYDLIREVYRKVNDDSHVTGIIEAIKNTIKSKEFELVDSEGNVDDEATAKFEKEWFFKFLDFTIESAFYGYSLVQLGDIVDDGFPDIELVPRENVVPEEDIVLFDGRTRSRGVENVFNYKARQNLPWFIFIGSDGLGLFNKAAPHAIAKRGLFAAMWQYGDLFGMPTRIGHTDIKDPDRKKNMEIMLDNAGSAQWGVFDNSGDTVEFIEADRTDAYKVFVEPIKLSNEEISKSFAGQVGMFDEKSFVGAAVVQAKLFREFILSFSRTIRFVVNNDLMPRMVGHGMLKDGLTYRFVSEESNTSIEKSAMIKELSPFFQFDPQTVTEAIGIKVEDFAEGPPPTPISAKMKELIETYPKNGTTSKD